MIISILSIVVVVLIISGVALHAHYRNRLAVEVCLLLLELAAVGTGRHESRNSSNQTNAPKITKHYNATRKTKLMPHRKQRDPFSFRWQILTSVKRTRRSFNINPFGRGSESLSVSSLSPSVSCQMLLSFCDRLCP